jgi:hypothetical protein
VSEHEHNGIAEVVEYLSQRLSLNDLLAGWLGRGGHRCSDL